MAKSKGPRGIIDGKLAPCGRKPNCVSSELGAAKSKIVAPLPTGDIAAITAAITDLGGEITAAQPGYLAAEFTSKIFKFVDDVEIRIDGDVAQIRSASRVGYSDNSVNRKRVSAIRAKLIS